jgi:hypothetical protein
MLKWISDIADTEDTKTLLLVDPEKPEQPAYGAVLSNPLGVGWAMAYPEGNDEAAKSETIREAQMEVERRMMCYPLDFSEVAVGRYTDNLHSFGEVIGIRRFKIRVKEGEFTDNDGHGRPLRNGKMDSECLVLASQLDAIPEDATHIQWYNK